MTCGISSCACIASMHWIRLRLTDKDPAPTVRAVYGTLTGRSAKSASALRRRRRCRRRRPVTRVPQDARYTRPSTPRQGCFGGRCMRLALQIDADRFHTQCRVLRSAFVAATRVHRPCRRTDPAWNDHGRCQTPLPPRRLRHTAPPATRHAKSYPAPRHGPLEVPVRLTEHVGHSRRGGPGQATFDRRMRTGGRRPRTAVRRGGGASRSHVGQDGRARGCK